MKKLLTIFALLFAFEAHAQTRTVTVTAQWVDNSDNEAGFVAERSVNKAPFAVLIASLAANQISFSDTYNGKEGDEVCYRVYAYNSIGNSAPSNVACFTIPVTLPTPPSGLKLSNVSGASITASWQPNDFDVLGQRLYREVLTGAGQPATIALANTTSVYVDKGVRRNTTYRYRACAWDLSGEACSNLAQVRTPNR